MVIFRENVSNKDISIRRDALINLNYKIFFWFHQRLNHKRVALFTDSFYPNVDGVSYRVREVASELSKRGFQVRVFAPGHVTGTENFDGFQVVRQRGFPFPLYPQYRIPLKTSFSMEEAVKFAPEIVHSHTPVSIGNLACRVSKKFSLNPLATFHTFINDPGAMSRYIHLGMRASTMISKAFNLYLVNFYRKFRYVVAPSAFTKSILERLGFRNVIRQDIGIDLSIFRNLPSKDEARNALGIHRSSKIVLYMGRIGAEKNLDVLARAGSRLAERGFSVLVCGTGPHLEELKILSERINAGVKFMGFIPEQHKPLYYRSADVFFNPSLFENQSAVDIEAMAAGTPILVPRNSSQFEFLSSGLGGDAYTAEEQIPDLAESLISRSDLDPATTASGYTVEKHVDRLLEIYGMLQ